MNAEIELNRPPAAGDNELDIAIIGMSCRFPGADNLDEFWANLVNGVDAITRLTDKQILDSGVPRRFLDDPNYVKAAPILDAPGFFAAGFFGFSPTEATTMDPQHRILLELAHEALEEAGCDPDRYPGRIGVFTGSAMNTYFMNGCLTSQFAEDYIPTLIVNDKDFLSTRISYKLNLKGPSITVQTACSTSLVALHLARQSLLSHESDMALVGAISVRVPHQAGYFSDGGGVVSPDGKVKAFDAGANGTVFGSGGGMIVVKRLADAIADRDTIHAVIKGSAVNNDGSEKAGYTAPSVNSQADAVVEALANAGVDAESVSYIEAHGSGTPVGDPIELMALTKAFRTSTQRSSYCAIGSVKTNLGHLDAAAGIAGIIKTVLSLEHQKIPASLHFSRSNPEINFSETPFYVNTKLTPWISEGPKRAGIMSTGMGGTNAHVVLEEAPHFAQSARSALSQLLIVSAKSSSALDVATNQLLEFLKSNSSAEIADVAYTLQNGRKGFSHRRTLICGGREDAIAVLSQEKSKRVISSKVDESTRRPVLLLLPGVGDHYVGMARDLYEKLDVFKIEVDRCANLLAPHLGIDIRTIIYANGAGPETPHKNNGIDLKKMLGRTDDEPDDPATAQLNQTIYAQPALFTIEYALARLWQHLGINPDAIVGHSMGEYVAACLAGVFSLPDALQLIAKRAKLANDLPQGAMLAVVLPESELLPLLNQNLSIALINGPNLCVVAGPVSAVAELERSLNGKSVITRPVRNAHAFHSKMLEPIVPAFVEELKNVQLHEPKIPFISNVTGNWITKEDAVNPLYWARHASRTARFNDALRQLSQFKNAILLETGPGKTLSVLAAQHPDRSAAGDTITISSLRHHYEHQSDIEFFYQNLGKLWLSGAQIDWQKLPEAGQRRKISLPTYPFERENYWLETTPTREQPRARAVTLHKNADLSKWFYMPSWKHTLARTLRETDMEETKRKGEAWIVFSASSFASKIIDRLQGFGQRVVTVQPGDSYQQIDSDTFVLAANNSDHFELLIRALHSNHCTPRYIIYAWNLTGQKSDSFQREDFNNVLDAAFYGPLFLVRALARNGFNGDLNLIAFSDHIQEVHGNETLDPAKSTLLGPSLVIPQEYPNIRARSIDLELTNEAKASDLTVDQILAEFFRPDSDLFIAYRNSQRWVQTSEQVELDKPDPNNLAFRASGVYLITGGLGDIGIEIAKHLVEKYRARLVLVGRASLPERDSWQSWIVSHEAADPVRQKIERMISLEKLGGQVLYLKAKVEDVGSMREVIRHATARFGNLHGVIHAAGVTGGQRYREIEEIDFAHGEAHFEVKAQALLVLEDLLQDRELDFVLLISSLTSVLGGIGHVAYASSCIFMDSFARKHNRAGATPWLSVNWDFWRVQQEGVAANSGFGKTIQGLGMTSKEALDVMEIVLPARSTSQLIVSTGDLSARIKQWITLESLHDTRQSNELDPKRAAFAQLPGRQTDYDSPRDATQKRVAEVWEKVLGIERVGINDNFSDLGGHSLLAIKIISELRKAFEIDLTIKALFEAPTVAELSVHIKEQKSVFSPPRMTEESGHEQERFQSPDKLLVEADAEKEAPPSKNIFFLPRWFIQQTTWVEDPSNSDAVIYNYPFLLRIHGELNETALRKSLEEIVRRHEVLRSVFRAKDGEVVQVVIPPSELSLQFSDLSNLPEAEREERARQIALEEADKRFDLTQGPLLRAKLMRVAVDDHILQFTTHHIVYDDWSTAIVSRELSALYQAFASGRSSPLAALSFQYHDFVRWQQERLQQGTLTSQLSYWRKQFAGSAGFYHLATDFLRPEKSGKRGARERVVFPTDLANALKALARQERVSLFMVLLAGFKCLLHRYSDKTDIGIGSCGANRPFAEVEGLIGRFGNAMLLRTDLSGNPTFRELLKRVSATALNAYSNQDIPFGKLMGETRNGTATSEQSPFQVMFILQNAAQEDPQIPGLKMNWSSLYNGTAKYDLDVWLKAEPELEVILEYRTDLFRVETMKQIMTDYRAILDAMVKNPGAKLSDGLAKRKVVSPRVQQPAIASAKRGNEPLDEMQKRLVTLWETAFRIGPIGVDQDFFELGGDSLLAARLFPQIEKAFGVDLPLAALLEAPTIRRLSERIGEIATGSLGSCLVGIRTSGSKPPLFCVHGHKGEVFYCRNLSNSLGADQPLYGIRSYGLGGTPPHGTIEEMAIHNLAEIRKQQPTGPYFLSGYCLGGLVAYEMARLLKMQNEEIALLALFNTPAPGSFKDWPLGRVYLTKRIAHEMRKLRELGIRGKLRTFRNKGRSLASLAFGNLKVALAQSSLGGAERAAQRLLNVADLNIAAAKAYAPDRYTGRITLFLTEEASLLYSIDPKEGWKALADGIEIHEVAGDNNSMFDVRFVDALADKLKSCLEQAQGGNKVKSYAGSHVPYVKETLSVSTATAPM